MPPPPPPPPLPPPPIPQYIAQPSKPINKSSGPAKKGSVKKGPPAPPSRDPGTQLMNKGSLNGPETAPKPKRRGSSQDDRPPSVNSYSSRPSSSASGPPVLPKRSSSTQLSESPPLNEAPTMVPAPPPPAPPPPPLSEAVYESVDELVATGQYHPPPPPSTVNQQNDELEESVYDYIPAPAVKPKPKRTSSSLSVQSSDVPITKAERDAIRRVSAVIQDEQLARASFHPSVGDQELIDDVYEDTMVLTDEVYDDTVSANQQAQQYRQSMVKNDSLTAVVPQPPPPPPIAGYEEALYDDTETVTQQTVQYKQAAVIDHADMDYDELTPQPPVAAPVAPPPPPIAQQFVPDQDYDELSPAPPPPMPPAPPPVAQVDSFVPDQDYDELPPKPVAPVPPPPPPVQDEDYDLLPPKPQVSQHPPPPPPPVAQTVLENDQIYDSLPPASEGDIYDVLPPKVSAQPPGTAPDEDYDVLPPAPRVPSTNYDTIVIKDRKSSGENFGPEPVAVVSGANRVRQPSLTGPDPEVVVPMSTGRRTSGHRGSDVPPRETTDSSMLPELDVLGTLVGDDAPEEDTFAISGQGDLDEFSALGNVLSNMEDKSSSEEGKWDLPSDDEEGIIVFPVLHSLL